MLKAQAVWKNVEILRMEMAVMDKRDQAIKSGV